MSPNPNCPQLTKSARFQHTRNTLSLPQAPHAVRLANASHTTSASRVKTPHSKIHMRSSPPQTRWQSDGIATSTSLSPPGLVLRCGLSATISTQCWWVWAVCSFRCTLLVTSFHFASSSSPSPELLTPVKRKHRRRKEMPFYHPIIPSDLHGKTLVVVSVITSLAFRKCVVLTPFARQLAVSTANVAQLAADLLIASLSLHLIGTFDSCNLVPVVGKRDD